MAVAIVVEKAAASPPAAFGASHTGLLRNVRKRAIAVVVVEDVSAETGHQQIVEAIVVIVAHAAGLSPGGLGESGLAGDVGEGAVAIVMEEIAGWFARREIGRT